MTVLAVCALGIFLCCGCAAGSPVVGRALRSAPPGRALTGLSGLHAVQVWQGELPRRYILYVPTQYRPEDHIPLWILAHGTDDSPEIFLKMSDMTTLAEKHNFAFAALEALHGNFNVGLNAKEENPHGPDDVGYTMAVLEEVIDKLNVDMQRIRCSGFSRGARFCSRLASELSSFVTGIAVVSGLRFPLPNNATRPLPVIAFHGTRDPVNPYNGMGNNYWISSVDDAVQRWASFNGCKRHVWERLTSQVLRSLHTDCKNGADVTLIQIVGGGHTWPGSWWDFGDLGYVTHEIAAQQVMWEFFRDHPAEISCHTAAPGESCYKSVTWAMQVGIVEHPDWYPGLSETSTFEDFQACLRRRVAADCPEPCAAPPTSTSTATTTTATPGRRAVTPSSSAAGAAGAAADAAAGGNSTSTTTQWIDVRWLQQDEMHRLAQVPWHSWVRPALAATGLAAVATAGLVMAFRARLRLDWRGGWAAAEAGPHSPLRGEPCPSPRALVRQSERRGAE